MPRGDVRSSDDALEVQLHPKLHVPRRVGIVQRAEVGGVGRAQLVQLISVQRGDIVRRSRLPVEIRGQRESEEVGGQDAGRVLLGVHHVYDLVVERVARSAGGGAVSRLAVGGCPCGVVGRG